MIKGLNYIGLILGAFFIATMSNYSQTPQKVIQATYQIKLVYAYSIFSNQERFEFTIGGGDKVVLTHDQPFGSFTTKFTAGQTYSISQVSGPRQCNFSGQERGTINNTNIDLTVDCGQPPFSMLEAQVTGIESGETFKFADEYGRSQTLPFNRNITLGFPVGDNYIYKQISGPRTCKMTNPQGIVPNTPFTIKVDCAKAGESVGTTNSENTSPLNVTGPDWDLVSRSSDDKSFGTFYDAVTPVIGGKGADEGRYVAFVSYATGLGGSTGKFRQIFWRDRKTGETRIVSASAANGEGNQNSGAPAISPDGKSVAFESYATNLTPDSNNVRDIFVWNADRNTITAVSENRGIEANSECFEPTISVDGNLIAFSSSADNLAPGVSGTSTVNVYLRDMRSGAVTLISKNEKDGKGGGGSRPSISEDGSRIAFYNYFPLTSDDKNNLWDIYVWQSGNPKLKRVSMTSERSDRDQGSESSSRVVSPTISGNGQFVTFATTAKNMVSGDTNGVQDVFVNEIDTSRVTRLSLGKDGQEPDSDTPIGQGEKISISYDGKWVVFSSNAKNLGGNILLKNVQTGETKIISTSQGITVARPDISRNGNFVIFGTSQRLDPRFQSSGLFVHFADISKR